VSAASTGRSVLSISGNLTLIVPLRGCAKLFQTVLSGFMPPTRSYFLFVNWSSGREQLAIGPSQRSLPALSRYLRDKRRYIPFLPLVFSRQANKKYNYPYCREKSHSTVLANDYDRRGNYSEMITASELRCPRRRIERRPTLILQNRQHELYRIK
jgi:hypothetical protein